jgi:DNA modification methylase
MDFYNKVYNIDCLIGIKHLPDNSVNCIVTSPPYFGLRDYGVDGQIGLEDTPEEYVNRIVQLFRECRRVLKDDGTLWLNLGDSYVGATSEYKEGGSAPQDSPISKKTLSGLPTNKRKERNSLLYKSGLRTKQLIGIPWRVAFALQADGWYLRQDIIWHKPNPMPESVTDRCTKAHEYIFLLSKSSKYYFDNESIKEPVTESSKKRAQYGWNGRQSTGTIETARNGSGFQKLRETGAPMSEMYGEKRNKRSVWTVTTKPYRGAHFAVYPFDLIEPCVKAGCPDGGVVLDPFMGAFTTAIVCKSLNRNFVGFELNPEYCEIGKNRMDEHFGVFNNVEIIKI